MEAVMARRTAIVLSGEEREVLERWARRPKTAQALAFRCRVVLAAAEGRSSVEIADELGCTASTVGKWRIRFAGRGLDGLHDLARRARRALCDLLGTEPIAPEEQVLQMASVRIPHHDPDLQRRLFADHRIEIPISDEMLMRVSIAMYNTEEDVERLLDALSVSLTRSARSPA
jgi:selenocysteine lyase/cysteine desulfurase